MKNQYFGDINDYHKYGLLRCFAAKGVKVGVCWMLTDSDGRTDGQKIRYLQDDQQQRWRKYDPELYDFLKQRVIIEKVRTVQHMSQHPIIKDAHYWEESLTRSKIDRLSYFKRMDDSFRTTDLVFFDPDTGMAGVSCPDTLSRSPQHLYWDEVETTFSRGHSVLIFQHFNRTTREDFIAQKLKGLAEHTHANECFSFRSANVVFLLAANPATQSPEPAISLLKNRWTDQFEV
jgi:hypothetical protein